jgi:formate transporter
VSRVLGGVTFSLGLVLVVVAGAELFTGNNLLVMAWADGRITTGELLRSWTIVYFANAFGAIGLAVIAYLAEHGSLNGGAVAATYVRIAAAKTALPFWEAFFKGVLCNLLVCLAVWLALAGRSVADKVLAIVFPISAFVAAGFEHSVANMYLIPLGIFLRGEVATAELASAVSLDWSGFVRNLIPVTLGNIVGGSLMVAIVYHLIYNRALSRPEAFAPANGGDFERGKLLYNARCVGCHDKSVHNRAARTALTIEGIKAQVRRWDKFMEGGWREEEVNDVTTYLNELYYQYPCTPAICPEKKASLAIHKRADLDPSAASSPR